MAQQYSNTITIIGPLDRRVEFLSAAMHDHRRRRWDRFIVTVEPHSWREDREESVLHFHSNGEPHNSISILIEPFPDLVFACELLDLSAPCFFAFRVEGGKVLDEVHRDASHEMFAKFNESPNEWLAKFQSSPRPEPTGEPADE